MEKPDVAPGEAARDQLRQRVLAWADADPRVVAGAVVGSLADAPGDRWSDLDLTFGVVDDVPVTAVLDDWTARLTAEWDAIFLFDVWAGPSLYRVFLVPGGLQFDLSMTPAAQFGALGPQFRLLFGAAVERPWPAPPVPRELFGRAVHHAIRARVCIERGRAWQAEYWISALRDEALALACLRHGVPARHARGFDALPPAVHALFAPTLVTGLEAAALRRALAAVVHALLAEGEAAGELRERARPELLRLVAAGPA